MNRVLNGTFSRTKSPFWVEPQPCMKNPLGTLTSQSAQRRRMRTGSWQNLTVCFYFPPHPLKVFFLFPSCQIFVGWQKRKPSVSSVVSLESLLIQPVSHFRCANAGRERIPLISEFKSDKTVRCSSSLFQRVSSVCPTRGKKKPQHAQHRMYSMWLNVDAERD